MAKKLIKLVVTSAFAVAGNIVKPQDEITLPEDEAKSLLSRGKVELAEAKDGDAEGWLESSTVVELREIAKEYEIDGADKMKKPDLIAAIEAAEAD